MEVYVEVTPGHDANVFSLRNLATSGSSRTHPSNHVPPPTTQTQKNILPFLAEGLSITTSRTSA